MAESRQSVPVRVALAVIHLKQQRHKQQNGRFYKYCGFFSRFYSYISSRPHIRAKRCSDRVCLV